MTDCTVCRGPAGPNTRPVLNSTTKGSKGMRTTLAVLMLAGMMCAEVHAQDPYNDATRALAARDTAAALAAFQEAVSQGQNVSESATQLAAIAFSRGRIDEAVGHLATALDNNSKNAHALKLYGDILLRQGRVREALVQYRKGAQAAPGFVDLGIALGRTLLAIDSVDAAVVQFSRAKLSAPQNPLVQEGLGDAFARQGVNIMAIRCYREAAKYAPKSIPLRMKLAHLLLEGRRYNEAVKVLRSIHDLDSTFAQAYMEEADVYYRAKMFRSALGPLRTYRRLQPGSARIDSMYLRALINAGEYRTASNVAAETLQRDSSSVETWRTYAHCLTEVKDYPAAISAFGGVQRRNGMSAKDECELGRAHMCMGDETGALAAYQRAVQADSATCEPYYDLGYLYMKSHDYARAAAMFEKRIQCDSTSLGSYLNAGACYIALADTASDRASVLTRARDLFIQAERYDPDNVTTCVRLAQYFVLVDSAERAKEEYEEVLKKAAVQPARYRKEAGEAYAQLAMYHSSRNQPERTIALFAKALSCGYENAAMQMNWGVAILQAAAGISDESEARGRAAEAVARFQRAVQLDPRSAAAHFWLGEGLIRLRVPGDDESVHKYTEEACAEFNKALAIDPHHEGALKEVKLRGCR
jgi:tetratricopeptide (TPR) repeat protein